MRIHDSVGVAGDRIDRFGLSSLAVDNNWLGRSQRPGAMFSGAHDELPCMIAP